MVQLSHACIYLVIRALSVILCFQLLFIPVASGTNSPQETTQITIPPLDNNHSDHAQYFVRLLDLALEKTKSEGTFIISHTQKIMSQARSIVSLEQGVDINVMWTMTSKERESRLFPIRIPLIKGLLGYRVFLIRKSDQALFNNITTLDELSEFKAGQGADWPDTKILQSNGLKVITNTKFKLLFSMLERQRFDYFPRGMSEAWSELEHNKDKGLMVEPTILLKYPAPMYFFVSQKNKALGERIERGLLQAINDGSFDDLFYNFPAHKAIFSQTNIEGRKQFELSNPYLSKETPINNESLWYRPDLFHSIKDK